MILTESAFAFASDRNNSNCIGFVAYALGLENQERALMPGDYNQLFAGFIKKNALSPIKIAPEGSLALVISQNSEIGPFFPLHMALIDPNDPSKIKHRPGAGTQIDDESLHSFMIRELGSRKEIFFLSKPTNP